MRESKKEIGNSEYQSRRWNLGRYKLFLSIFLSVFYLSNFVSLHVCIYLFLYLSIYLLPSLFFWVDIVFSKWYRIIENEDHWHNNIKDGTSYNSVRIARLLSVLYFVTFYPCDFLWMHGKCSIFQSRSLCFQMSYKCIHKMPKHKATVVSDHGWYSFNFQLSEGFSDMCKGKPIVSFKLIKDFSLKQENLWRGKHSVLQNSKAILFEIINFLVLPVSQLVITVWT